MRRYQRRLAALHVISALLLICIPIFAQDLPVDIVREKSIHIQTAMEESKITIKDTWDHPDLERLRMSDAQLGELYD